jgi:hypothetical protein
MTKNFIVLLIIICFFTCCKKNYSCECGGGIQQRTIINFHGTKSNAEKSCKSQPTNGRYDPDRKCMIK